MGGISHTDSVIQAPAFIGGMIPPGGRTFFFNPNASGARNAERPWYDVDEVSCFSTLQGAIDACVADRGDVIYVARGYHAPTATVNFNKAGISVIGGAFGMNPYARGEWCGINPSNTDGPAARITKMCYITGLGFYGNQTSGDTYDASVIIDGSGGSTDGYGTWLHRCRFGNWNSAAVDYGVYNLGAAKVRIEDCAFAGGNTNPFDAAILADGSTTGGGRPGEIDAIGNWFEDSTYAMEIVTGSYVSRSRFMNNHMGYNVPGTAWVKAIKAPTTIGTHNKCLVCDNYFPTAVDTGTFSHTLSAMETGGFIMSGNHYKADLQQV